MGGEIWILERLLILLVQILFHIASGRYQRFTQHNICSVGNPGYKADVMTACETYFYCHADGGKESFSCPYGLLFDERRGQCDLPNNIHCPMPFNLLQDAASAPMQGSGNQQQPYANFGQTPPPFPAPYHVGSAVSPNALPTPAAQGNPMDFLAALLFPPLSGQQDLNEFMNTAPSGVRQAFLRVVGEGGLPHGHGSIPSLSPPAPQTLQPYVEPFTGAGHRPMYTDPNSQTIPTPTAQQILPEGVARSRESPGSNGATISRRLRPSPAMNPNDASALVAQMTQMQGGPPQAYDTGPVPPHLMGGHTYMFGQLSMHNQSAAASVAVVPPPPSPPQTAPPGPPPTGHSAQVEALKPLLRSLMHNPYQPHLRRMASLLAAGTAMDLNMVSNKMLTDPMMASGTDPALASGKKGSGKALDDGLVDAKK